MKKIWKIIKREFITKVFTRGFIIATVLGPFFIVGISFGPAYFMSLQREEPLTIQVVDSTYQVFPELATVFNDTLKNGQPRFIFNSIEPEVYRSRRNAIRRDIEQEKIDGLLVIPADLFQGKRVRYYAKSVSDYDLMNRLRSGISEIVNNHRLREAGVDPALLKNLIQKVQLETIKVVKGKEKKSGFDQEYFTSFTFLLLLYMTILMYGNNIMRSVIEEKTSRIVEVLLSSANSFQLMAGKLFGVGLVGLVQYAIWALMGIVAFLFAASQMPGLLQFVSISPQVLIYFIVFFIVGFFTFSTLYAAVGSMCSDMQDAQSLSTPVTLLVIIPFVISFSVMKNPSSSLAQILSYTPFFTPIIMFTRVILVTPPVWEIGLSLLINFLVILGIIWLSARIYRVGILMYGKRPTLPEILRWVRYR